MMNLKHVVVASALAVISQLSYAQTFYSGNELGELIDANNRLAQGSREATDYQKSALFIGYVTGVADSLSGFYCPGSATIRQIVAVVKKSMAAHPEDWAKSGNILVATALVTAFPCSKK